MVAKSVTPSLVITITTDRIRQLLAKKGNVSQATTQDAEAFLALYGRQLEEYLNTNTALFVAAKQEAGMRGSQ